MKKKLFMGVFGIFLMFFGIIGVNAEEKYLNFSKDDREYNVSDEKHTIFFDTNLDPVEGEKIYYKIDDGQYKVEEVGLSNIDIDGNLLKDKAEHKITVYGELADGTKTKEISVDILTTDIIKVSNEQFKLNLTLENFPINTKMNVTEVKDEKIISNIKLQNPNVIKVRFESEGKDLGYYNEKYGKFVRYNFKSISGTFDISWTERVSISSDKEGRPINNLNVYGLDGNYKILVTDYDEVASENNDNVDNIYELDYLIYSNDIFINGYIAIDKGDGFLDFELDQVTPEITEKQEENPKTADINNNLALLILAGSIGLVVIGKKKLKKLSK